METILVTGGAGFIGGNFVKAFSSEYNIVVFDALTYASNFGYIRDDVGTSRFELGDIRNLKHLKKIFDKHKPRYVVNFAAESHVDNSIDCPLAFVETNIVGTACVLEAMRLSDHECRLVQISTDEVYGSIQEGSFVEESSLNPSSPYSSTKSAADQLVLSYYKTYGLDVVVTHSSNNYGPNQHPEKLIPKIIDRAINFEVIPIYGDGTNVREWTHVSDNANAIRLVMEKGRSGERYNIGSGVEATNLHLATQLCNMLDEIKGVFNKPRLMLIQFTADRPAHDMRYSVNSSKIKSHLGWEPMISLEEGLMSTIKWYIKNYSEMAKGFIKRNSAEEPLLINSLQCLIDRRR